MTDPTIRPLTLSTVMLSREDLDQARLAMLFAAAELPMSDELKRRIAGVADALSSITTHTGVQAIACAETVAEAPSEASPAVSWNDCPHKEWGIEPGDCNCGDSGPHHRLRLECNVCGVPGEVYWPAT